MVLHIMLGYWFDIVRHFPSLTYKVVVGFLTPMPDWAMVLRKFIQTNNNKRKKINYKRIKEENKEVKVWTFL